MLTFASFVFDLFLFEVALNLAKTVTFFYLYFVECAGSTCIKNNFLQQYTQLCFALKLKRQLHSLYVVRPAWKKKLSSVTNEYVACSASPFLIRIVSPSGGFCTIRVSHAPVAQLHSTRFDPVSLLHVGKTNLDKTEPQCFANSLCPHAHSSSSSNTPASIGSQQCLFAAERSKRYSEHALAQVLFVSRAPQQDATTQFFVGESNFSYLRVCFAHMHFVVNKHQCSVPSSVRDACTGCATLTTNNSVQV